MFKLLKEINNLKFTNMKTLIILIMSSLFFSNIKNNKENDSIEKVMKIKIKKNNVIINNDVLTTRMPIIILKRD